MRYNFYLFLFFLVLFTSCENTFYNIIMRTTEDPFPDLPVARSFELEHTIDLSWKFDPATDIYVLMRAEDSYSPVFEEIYRGNACSYTDKDVGEMKRYKYRLDKIRGRKYFKGTELCLAACSNVRKDSCEDNNIEAKATFLESDYIANIPCFEFFDGQQLYDEDWYYISVPPRMRAEVVINQTDRNLAARADTDFYYLIPGNTYAVVSNMVAFQLSNPTYETVNIPFKIYPNLSTSFTGSTSKSIILTYTITLTQLVRY